MSAQQDSAANRSPATPPPGPVSEEDWFRRYNERPGDTAMDRATGGTR